MSFIDPDNPLAAEILQEAAEAYFAACRKMVKSLEALKTFDCAAASSVQNDKHMARRSELLGDAAERVYSVLVQRDAMKLSGAETFFADYGIPDEVKAQLGKQRRK